jgi:DNA-binding NtrC family response regulator
MKPARNSRSEEEEDMQTPILIVHTDSRMRSALREALEPAEYAVVEALDAESGLVALRASERCMVVLFDVAIFNNTLTGLDSVAILGAAAHDSDLADRHAFVVISPTPRNVELVFGSLLRRIGAPIVAEPVNPERLRRAIADAERRLLIAV